MARTSPEPVLDVPVQQTGVNNAPREGLGDSRWKNPQVSDYHTSRERLSPQKKKWVLYLVMVKTPV